MTHKLFNLLTERRRDRRYDDRNDRDRNREKRKSRSRSRSRSDDRDKSRRGREPSWDAQSKRKNDRSHDKDRYSNEHGSSSGLYYFIPPNLRANLTLISKHKEMLNFKIVHSKSFLGAHSQYPAYDQHYYQQQSQPQHFLNYQNGQSYSAAPAFPFQDHHNQQQYHQMPFSPFYQMSGPKSEFI